MELPGAIVPKLETSPTIVPVPPSTPDAPTVTGLVSVPLIRSRPLSMVVAVNVESPDSAQSVPLIVRSSKARNWSSSDPEPMRMAESVPVPPWAAPSSTDPVPRVRVFVPLPKFMDVPLSPRIVPVLVSVVLAPATTPMPALKSPSMVPLFVMVLPSATDMPTLIEPIVPVLVIVLPPSALMP